MPEIDLSEVLLDSVVAGEWFTVIRRPDVVGSNGQTTIGAIQFQAIGQITPIGPNSILREEAFTTDEKAIRVTTSFMLRGPSKDPTMQNFQPDIIMWRGNSYIVRTIADFSKYGPFGMITAECSSIDYVENAPRAPPLLDTPSG